LKETELRFRQIHLDFHTSESIEGIGSDFDPDEGGRGRDSESVQAIWKNVQAVAVLG
jgi:hypothetical protein